MIVSDDCVCPANLIEIEFGFTALIFPVDTWQELPVMRENQLPQLSWLQMIFPVIASILIIATLPFLS